jgi:uncharacterized protein (TIGR03437 family)
VRRCVPGLLCLLLPVALRAAGGPELLPTNIVNAADHSAGKVAPGEIVLLYPTNIGDRREETRILFDNIAAPIVFSVKGQLCAFVPYEVANKQTTEVVVEYQGARSSPVTLQVVDSAPAVFTLDPSGTGQASMLNETGCCNSARNPAAPGSIAALYATGEGQTTPPGVTGKVSDYDKIAGYPVPRLPVSVTVGGEPAEIVFAGEAPHSMAGLLQVNFRVPANAPAGDAVPVVLMVGSARSLDGVTMAIRSPVQRILAIDPDPAALRWLRRVLEGAGYQVATAVDLAEAIRQAHQHPIDLVICSLILPSDRRLETIRAMQAERPQLKIVATTRQLGPRALRNADLLGAQAVITTPMATQEVLQRVRELLQPRPVPYVAH